MKTYVKPTVDVIELSVRENMAALPAGVQGNNRIMTHGTYGDVVTTVYDLTAVSTSGNI